MVNEQKAAFQCLGHFEESARDGGHSAAGRGLAVMSCTSVIHMFDAVLVVRHPPFYAIATGAREVIS